MLTRKRMYLLHLSDWSMNKNSLIFERVGYEDTIVFY